MIRVSARTILEVALFGLAVAGGYYIGNKTAVKAAASVRDKSLMENMYANIATDAHENVIFLRYLKNGDTGKAVLWHKRFLDTDLMILSHYLRNGSASLRQNQMFMTELREVKSYVKESHLRLSAPAKAALNLVDPPPKGSSHRPN